ncbi:MAG TPA: ketopantoate reductase family protein [Methylomirabilota bacterium]|nr:ketopantoate reductase family protein [Methylomirabilota bacterium]
MKKVCVIGAGAIGSLYAAHLARVAEVYLFVRRPEHARALNAEGLRVSGLRHFHARVRATCDAFDLPQLDLGIVSCKAAQTKAAVRPVASPFRNGVLFSSQNGLGCEEMIYEITNSPVIRGTTFMSGVRLSDTEVQFDLDQPSWMGPFEPSHTPFSIVKDAAHLIASSGLKAVALEDARPAQWSKLIFNASVNAVSALAELPHSPHFAAEKDFSDLGHLLHDLIEEGKRVAAKLGIRLHEDPWEMNKIGAPTDHVTSMLSDVRSHSLTEVDYLGGAIAREAQRLGVPAPLNTALYRLIKAKEASWTYAPKAHKSGAG